MSTAIATKTGYTPEDLLAMPDGKSYELVDGQLVERKMGIESSWVADSAGLALDRFCEEHRDRMGLAGRERLPVLPSRSRPGPQARCLVHPVRPLPGRSAAQGLGQDPSRPGGRGRLAQRHG